MAPTRILPPLLGTAATAGVALTSYALWEARQYTLREVTVPLLPAGADPLRVLHLSDVHMTPGQTRKQEWLSGLAGLEPDLVINTGDNLSHRRAVGPVLDAYAGLLDVPGVFVFGSNDYFDPGLRNPVGYLFPDSGRRHTHRPALPWRELRDAFTDSGWLDLSNRRGRLRVKGLDLAFAGVDDPHVRYDRLDDVAGRADPASDARIGVVHAPYLRVLDQWAADGYDAIIAGHTHGGQVCLPGSGALTTNCDLEPARAKGLHRHPAGSAPGEAGSAWLHVSAGVGTNPYTRIRIACRPEATLLRLVAR